jgi:iron complex outermembrane recepter protein
LSEENRLEYDVFGPVSQAGETENTGIDFEWVGHIVESLDVNLSYSYIDIDRQLMTTPRHRASLWGSYAFEIAGIEGLSAGGGVRCASDFTGGEATPTTPSVTLADIMIAWDDASWRVALNANNVTDKEHFSSCVSWGDLHLRHAAYGDGKRDAPLLAFKAAQHHSHSSPQ